MKKNFLLMLIMLLSAVSASAYDFVQNGIYYDIYSTTNKTVEVTYKDSNYNSYSGNVTIPSTVTYNGTTYSVFRIGSSAFESCSSLTSVTIGNGVTEIDNYAFYECTALTNLIIPNSVTEIGWMAFASSGLTSVTIGSGVTKIYWGAFNCNLTSVTCLSYYPPVIDDAWGDYGSVWPAFIDETLTDGTLYVPSGSVNAYRNAHGWCDFANIVGINYSFEVDGIYYRIIDAINNTVSVTNRDDSYNSYSGNVTIPSSVTYNGTTYSVTTIGSYAFYLCDGLTSVTIPTSVTTISYSAFRDCTSLTSVTIPSTVTSIYSSTFAGCSRLTNVSIPNTVTSIGNYAFQECTSLTSMRIPNSVTTLGERVFEGCNGLKNVTIGSGVTSIGYEAFKGCTALKSVTSLATTPPTIQSNTFLSSTYSNAALVVPSASINAYQTANYWKNFTTVKSTAQYLTDALNVTGSTFSFTSQGDYPWLGQSDGTYTYAQSSNMGVHSSTSVLTATVNVGSTSTLSFDFKAWGEGSSSLYDKCTFAVDGTEKFSYGSRQNDWESYNINLAIGTHTLTWTYSKDSSVHPKGDYFAIRNVKLTAVVPEPYACYTSSNTTLTFYYDNLRNTRTGTIYDLNTGSNQPGWCSDGTCVSVTKVVFDRAFANARPTTTSLWFAMMANLTSITGMSYLNTEDVTSMLSMFHSCGKLTSLDLSNFSTAKVISMAYMFHNCSGLTSVDVSGFNTSKVINMGYMFNACSNLTTIYAGDGWTTDAVTTSGNMFNKCTKLVGGKGTTFDANHVDKAYAHIDGGPSNPGYFTGLSQAGDVNGDGSVTIADVTSLIDILLNGGTAPAGADVNGDGSVTIADVTALIDMLLGS